jgi:TM2 domain-containing membrane protein YozV
MKNRGISIVLALFLGGFGIHRFYLGQITSGVFMLIFFWTFIPAIIGLVDAIGYWGMGEKRFQKNYSTV